MTLSSLKNLDVSRETLDKLDRYRSLIKKWNPKINLISQKTISELWSRHVVDSAQIFEYAEADRLNWCDFGSGGGFPALVVSILSSEAIPNRCVTLVESDQRKAAFLATVAHDLSLNVRIIAERIENILPLQASVISARALASLDDLLSYSKLHLAPSGQCLFLKGEHWRDEVADAQKNWAFSFDPIPSITDSRSVILKVENIERV